MTPAMLSRIPAIISEQFTVFSMETHSAAIFADADSIVYSCALPSPFRFWCRSRSTSFCNFPQTRTKIARSHSSGIQEEGSIFPSSMVMSSIGYAKPSTTLSILQMCRVSSCSLSTSESAAIKVISSWWLGTQGLDYLHQCTVCTSSALLLFAIS